jgi:hypothetical protein
LRPASPRSTSRWRCCARSIASPRALPTDYTGMVLTARFSISPRSWA